MKSLRTVILICVSVLVLGGCATSPVMYSEASPVSSSNHLSGYSKYSQPTEQSSRVIIVRDSGLLGAASPTKLSIDGIGVAEFWSSQRLELFMLPDSYIFSVEPSPRLGGALVEKDVQIKNGKSYAFRISLDGSGAFSLQPSTQLQ